MKIYCILNDSVPYGTDLGLKKFKHLTQISNCFTNTSVISMLTGKMPSDLEEGGIGYHTQFENKTNGIVDYSWKDQLLISQLSKQGWDINFHNSAWFYLTICDDPFIKKSHSLPCELDKEADFKGTKKYTKVLESPEFYAKEKAFIEKIQSDKSKKNQFYFIKNCQYHQALIAKTDTNKAVDNIKQVLSYFNFAEPNALFWIFSDHSDFTKIDKLCQAPSFLTDVYVKNNSNYRFKVENGDVISIRDFHFLIFFADEFIVNLREEDNPGVYAGGDKVFFVEDARCDIDPLNSTTAVACKFNGSDELEQVSYFKPENKYYGFKYNLVSKKIFPCKPDIELAQAVQRRFKWIR